MRRGGPALLTVVALTLAACSDDANDAGPATGSTIVSAPVVEPVDSTPPTTARDRAPTTVPATAPLTDDITVSPGTEQVTVTGLEPGTGIELLDDAGAVIATATADDYGAVLFRRLDGGAVVQVAVDGARSEQVKVMARGDFPDPAFYAEQRLATDGDLSYIETRDGTTLSATVWLPGPADDGPYPTVVEYSGYSPSDPESQGFSQLLNALGYAYVGVNMRGTGCSGGSYRFFEYAQSLDGYDVIETVAAQPWVQGHRVGMVGVSYPGISQLFVAQTQPPSLAAITPLSVIADSYLSTLYPGGILNTGFAVEWTQQRLDEAQPAGTEGGGQRWAADRIADGDEVCAANQELRLQNPDLVTEIEEHPYWNDELGRDIAPRLFVDRIDVPVFLAGAWQDEQTGGHFATMLDRFTGTDHFYATLVNGLHTESISPAVFPRFVEFLDLYVAERVPSLDAARAVATVLAGSIFATDSVALPTEDRFAGMTYGEARAAFESEPPIEVLFEQGAAAGFAERTPMARFSAGFDAWPVPDAAPARWYLSGSGARGTPGALVRDARQRSDVERSEYLALPDATPATFYDGETDLWSTGVVYDWQQGGAGTYAAFVTPPLDADTAIVGSGSVDLWIAAQLVDGAPAGDTDLEVTISEVTPDGDEVYVQSGWLRASQRALDEAASTELRPVHTHLEPDAAELPDREPEPVRVELFPVAHVFRAGSQIRLTIDAPGGNRAVWEFVTLSGGERVTIIHDAEHPSSLVLPVVPLDVEIPAERPACGALRGQPCRPYLP